MSRVFNFSAGPATLPTEVMVEARDEFLDAGGSGMSVMEMSHRSKQFMAIAEQAESDLRELMSIPSDYRVLFLQGGATTQFSMVPLNLLHGRKSADYLLTGYWGAKAVKEAGRVCEVNLALDAGPAFNSIPDPSTWNLNPDAAFVHYTPNETIGGVEFGFVPDTHGVSLVADMSSNILSMPVDVSRYAVIYAGAQKNIGPSGLTVVIVRDDVMQGVPDGIPSMLDYRAHANAGSMYNTPPTYPWYLAGKVFQWVKRQGGVEAMAERNARKAKKLYDFIDASTFYANPIEVSARSRMNVPFTLADDALDGTFVEEAEAAGLANLKGHRSVGGMRASIYNAMPEEGVDALIEFMRAFESARA